MTTVPKLALLYDGHLPSVTVSFLEKGNVVSSPHCPEKSAKGALFSLSVALPNPGLHRMTQLGTVVGVNSLHGFNIP